MRSSSTPQELSRAELLIVAARAEADPRTVTRAINDGIESIRGVALRERIRAALSTVTEQSYARR